MRQCLFCDNPANSKEHVWPDWILKSLRVREPIRIKLGKSDELLVPNSEQQIKAVCKPCNNGWMSALEQSNMPLIGNLIHDVAFSMNGFQQLQVAKWAVKMAMVSDFTGRSSRELFFDQAEREQLRVASNLPYRTTVSLARYRLPSHIGLWGTDSWCLDKSIHAFVATVLVGHLAMQVVTLRCTEQWDGVDVTVKTADAPGKRPWPQMLTEVWPTKVSAQWPPNTSFKDTAEFSRLVRRYSYGKNLLEPQALEHAD